ncbi:prolyl aminopeptidase [Azoarcus sp. KH32C]|uniref:prolyl aminopeptidase n=1 Tax=Azoarcus sp. KH32C TaxID=748247 RepID=UPI00034531A7|nr:prolyl aminopeptidase [Azoarcus sp. KH32C]
MSSPGSPNLIFPAVDSLQSGALDVGDGHTIQYEQCGNPAGLPVVVLHGGPASGCSPRMRQLFDPTLFRVVLFDQRGCGRSTPRGECAHNTTLELVADIERLRAHLGIGRWLVAGGSWGAALGVAYCAAHREACLGAVLRGIFLTGRDDLDWFFHAAPLAPEAWSRLTSFVPEAAHGRVGEWLFDAASGPDEALAVEAVRHWIAWEQALDSGQPQALPQLDDAATQAALDKYRVQAHYLRRECFLGEDELLRRAVGLFDLPVAIVHGRQDRVCRPSNALRLHEAIGGSRLKLVAGAGHNPFDAPMLAAFAGALAHFAAQGDFSGWADGDPA